MIEILRPDGVKLTVPSPVAFSTLQGLVGGYVEVVTINEGGKTIQCCCNEDGLSMGLAKNQLAMDRFAGKILMAPAVGVWVILSDEDLLS